MCDQASDGVTPASDDLVLRPIGTVASSIRSVADAPRQGDEGAPPAAVVVDPTVARALDGIAIGDRLVVATWLHLADRTALSTRPRGDPHRPIVGVFATRSPGRPNPIGLHEVTVTAIDGTTLTVDGLEAIDGTPVLDIKPILGPRRSR